ncbi:MAG: hypothetical protein Q8N88_00960, partial [Nanoarchaeota archaeon]|nr:hypothetical protein [Nanoarchaeota archaeon]
KKQIDEQRDILRQEIRKYQLLENEAIACQNQKGELTLLNEYLANKQALAESGIQSIVIPNYYAPRQNNLTFYCTAGGTVFDSNYTPPSINDPSYEGGYYAGDFTEEKVGCPVELNTGEVLDEMKELAILEAFKLDNISLFIDKLTKEIQEMEELTFRCNDTSACEDSTACFPNICYGHCTPPPDPCSVIAFACRSRCFQAPGGTHGTVCPTLEMEVKIAEIKETEKKLFEEIGKAEKVFPKIPKLKTDLNNLDVSAGLCYGSDFLNPSWGILNCQSAIGNYDKNGQLITVCHPRNLFCCIMPGASQPPLPVSSDTEPFYIEPSKKLEPLKSVGGCPEGWLCDPYIGAYNQYKDASEPLKQLLACMRPKLDIIKEDAPIGVISRISDPGIFHKTCGWETGELESSGCQFAYNVEFGKEKVSAHYGGLSCRYNRQSYAVDISLQGELQRRYTEEIINAAKECSPGAYIIDESPYLHVDVAQINDCSASE